MRAVVLNKPVPMEDGPLSLLEVDDPEPGRGQILLEVVSCGVCRSNLHMIEGDWLADGNPAFTPIIPGHEVVGRIRSLGEGVDHFKVGDRVGVMPLWSTCGWCEFCTAGLDHLCQTKEITGETVNGGFAELMVANARHTYLLPDSIPFEEAAPLFCPGVTAYGSVTKARLSPGKSLAVFGIGGVGHMVLQMGALTGADLYAVARGREHLALGEELGATPVDATAGDPAAWLQGRGGVDASIVFAPSDAVVEQAIRATRPGGTIVIGVHAKVGALPFPDEKTVVGSLLSTRQQVRDMLKLAAAGKLKAQCQPFSLEEAPEALTALKRGEIRARAVLMV